METAELHRPALIDPQDTKTLRSGSLDERTKAMHQASNGSAEREAG
jgi:hypothetical protein